jgi:hypothetical protein
VNRRAGILLIVTALIVPVMVLFSAGQEEAFDTVLYGTLALTLSTVGLLVVSRHPAHRVGWLFCVLGLWTAIAELSEGYGYYAADHGLAGGAVGEWIISWSWILDGAVWALIILLFPTGRLPSPRWRKAAYVLLLGFALALAGQALSTDNGDSFSAGKNPLGVDSPVVEIAFAVGIVLFLGALVAAVISLVMRLRRAGGVERQQLKWFAYAGLGIAAILPLAAAFWYVDGFNAVIQPLVAVALNALPVAVGIAILRYRLYDIDVLIRRTLIYGALTATLAAAYLGTVVLLQVLLQPLTKSSNLAIACSTLAVAALFAPARRRIQELVDRRFYRRRYDAARTLERFGARLRDEVALDSLSSELRRVVYDTMQPAHISLWLRNASRTPSA